MSEQTKDDIIKAIYKDKTGFGSIETTWKKAKERDDSITKQNVKDWFFNNVEKTGKTGLKNSFINDEAYDEYQIDLIFFGKEEDDKNMAMSIIDIFSKYAVVIPMKDKKGPTTLAAVMQGMTEMNPHKRPKRIYCDNERVFLYNLSKLMKELGIELYVTKHGAMINERFNRTFKNMIWKRLKDSKKSKTKWREFLDDVLDVYNNQMVSSATGMTPAEARKKENTLQVKVNLEMRRHKTSKYPDLNVGDNVKTFFKKRTQNKKENVSNWSDRIYKVERTSQSFGQTYYHLQNQSRAYLRHDLLKVP